MEKEISNGRSRESQRDSNREKILNEFREVSKWFRGFHDTNNGVSKDFTGSEGFREVSKRLHDSSKKCFRGFIELELL